MCAICGIYDEAEPPAEDALRAMMDAQAHRGPDGAGLFLDGPIGLGHRRLSVVDPAGGAQPMRSADGRVLMVANAEIYDLPEMRARLSSMGHAFATRCDVEVILRGYEAWGIDVVSHLRGMFAFAIWDARERRLLLARDRFGEKPLHYRLSGRRLAFASDARALARLPGAGGIDDAGLATYLLLDYVPAPRSIWSGVRKLRAGERLVLDGRGVRVERYFALAPGGGFRGSHGEAAELLRARFDDAVRRQMVADVPVGVFLSGGIDSTLIAASAVQHAPRLSTFTVGFGEEGFDEARAARETARRLGTEHHEVRLQEEQLPHLLEQAMGAIDEPLADPALLPMHLVSGLAREHVVVALGGDGSDELNAGYDSFVAATLDRWTRPLDPAKRALLPLAARAWPASDQHFGTELRLRQLARGASFPAALRPLAWMFTFLPEEIAELTGRRPALDLERSCAALLDGAARDPVHEAMHLVTRVFLEGDILAKVDRASMAHSLEVRSPFLDPPLAELLVSLPASFKLRGLRRKWLLHAAFERRLRGIWAPRRKHGLWIPVGRWMRRDREGLFTSVLLDPSSHRALGISRRPIERLLSAHRRGRANLRKPLWNLATLFLWLDAQRRSARPT